MGLDAKNSSVPFIHQGVPQNSGPACICMVLAHHGKEVPLWDMVMACLVTEEKGTNAFQMVQAAQNYGMKANGVRLETGMLHLLPIPAILHWDFNHFVVLKRITDSHVFIIDPEVGEIVLEWEEATQHFTGVALMIEPQDEAVQAQGATAPAVPPGQNGA